MRGWLPIFLLFAPPILATPTAPTIYGQRIIVNDYDDDVSSDRDEFSEQLRLNDSEFRMFVYGEHVNDLSIVWLSRYHDCRVFERNGTVVYEEYNGTQLEQMVRVDLGGGGGEWRRPMYVCTLPNATTHRTLVTLPPDSISHWYLIAVIVFLAALSALFTGLNIGLMALSIETLRNIQNYDSNKRNQVYAANILPIRASGNFTMCTIILGNTIANTILTVLIDLFWLSLDVKVEIWVSYVITTVCPTIILLFIGEIFPQVVCTKYALFIGSHTRHLMMFFMVLLFPLSWPLSIALDWMIGKDTKDFYDQEKLRTLIQQEKEAKEKGGPGRDTFKETALIATMDMADKRAGRIMTSIAKVFMLSENTVLNVEITKVIFKSNHTRIPVHKIGDTNVIVGILNVKNLVLIDLHAGLTAGTVMELWYRSTLFRYVPAEMSVTKLMSEMKKDYTIAVVMEWDGAGGRHRVQGIVTLEDAMEEVIGEIQDEKDVQAKEARTRSALERSKTPSPPLMVLEKKASMVNSPHQLAPPSKDPPLPPPRLNNRKSRMGKYKQDGYGSPSEPLLASVKKSDQIQQSRRVDVDKR